MRNTYIGLAAAAALLVVLFVVSRLAPGSAVNPRAPKPEDHTPQEIAQAVAKVTPGFVGSVQIGVWNLSCGKATVPVQLNTSAAKPSTAAKPADVNFGRCRSALLVRNRGKAVALIAVFRLVEGTDEVALILHTPPIVKPGSKVLVALAEKQVIGLPVTNCEKNQCIALGLLKAKVYPLLLARPKLAVVVPIQADGRRMIIPLSTVGLPQSVEAMRRAG